MKRSIKLLATGAALAACWSAQAATVQLTVTAESLVPANSISFAPLQVGINDGTFDSFDKGDEATAPIISIAEGGSGTDWFPAFAAADPDAVLGTVGGLLQPGDMASNSFMVDTMLNPFFTFAAMVVPSNDFFIGNDSPTAYELFDAVGGLQTTEITLYASDIWDAGSELFDPAAAAFVGDNSLRTPQDSVVAFQFAELFGFDGLTTAAGYIFDSQLMADTPIYRISFESSPVPSPVPVPAALPLFSSMLAGMGFLARRRRSAQAAA